MKRILALLAVLCLTIGTAAAFSDVCPNDWYSSDVDYVAAHGLMSGISASAFAPDASVTRGMAVTVLYRMAGSPAVSGTTAFSDVRSGTWYCDAVTWAKNLGIAAGYDSGTFGPNDTVTREQLAVFLWRYARCAGMEIPVGVLGGFCDAGTVSSWATTGVKYAVGAGLLSGEQGGLLCPRGVASRAELATVLHRFTIPVVG